MENSPTRKAFFNEVLFNGEIAKYPHTDSYAKSRLRTLLIHDYDAHYGHAREKSMKKKSIPKLVFTHGFKEKPCIVCEIHETDFGGKKKISL